MEPHNVGICLVLCGLVAMHAGGLSRGNHKVHRFSLGISQCLTQTSYSPCWTDFCGLAGSVTRNATSGTFCSSPAQLQTCCQAAAGLGVEAAAAVSAPFRPACQAALKAFSKAHSGKVTLPSSPDDDPCTRLICLWVLLGKSSKAAAEWRGFGRASASRMFQLTSMMGTSHYEQCSRAIGDMDQTVCAYIMQLGGGKGDECP